MGKHHTYEERLMIGKDYSEYKDILEKLRLAERHLSIDELDAPDYSLKYRSVSELISSLEKKYDIKRETILKCYQEYCKFSKEKNGNIPIFNLKSIRSNSREDIYEEIKRLSSTNHCTISELCTRFHVKRSNYYTWKRNADIVKVISDEVEIELEKLNSNDSLLYETKNKIEESVCDKFKFSVDKYRYLMKKGSQSHLIQQPKNGPALSDAILFFSLHKLVPTCGIKSLTQLLKNSLNIEFNYNYAKTCCKSIKYRGEDGWETIKGRKGIGTTKTTISYPTSYERLFDILKRTNYKDCAQLSLQDVIDIFSKTPVENDLEIIPLTENKSSIDTERTKGLLESKYQFLDDGNEIDFLGEKIYIRLLIPKKDFFKYDHMFKTSGKTTAEKATSPLIIELNRNGENKYIKSGIKAHPNCDFLSKFNHNMRSISNKKHPRLLEKVINNGEKYHIRTNEKLVNHIDDEGIVHIPGRKKATPMGLKPDSWLNRRIVLNDSVSEIENEKMFDLVYQYGEEENNALVYYKLITHLVYHSSSSIEKKSFSDLLIEPIPNTLSFSFNSLSISSGWENMLLEGFFPGIHDDKYAYHNALDYMNCRAWGPLTEQENLLSQQIAFMKNLKNALLIDAFCLSAVENGKRFWHSNSRVYANGKDEKSVFVDRRTINQNYCDSYGTLFDEFHLAAKLLLCFYEFTPQEKWSVFMTTCVHDILPNRQAEFYQAITSYEKTGISLLLNCNWIETLTHHFSKAVNLKEVSLVNVTGVATMSVLVDYLNQRIGKEQIPMYLINALNQTIDLFRKNINQIVFHITADGKSFYGRNQNRISLKEYLLSLHCIDDDMPMKISKANECFKEMTKLIKE